MSTGVQFRHEYMRTGEAGVQEYNLDMSTGEQERHEYRSTFLDMSTRGQERQEYSLDMSTGEQEKHEYLFLLSSCTLVKKSSCTLV